MTERMEEKNRLEREAKERENQRKKQELEDMQFKIKQEKVDALKNTAVGKRAFADITNEVNWNALEERAIQNNFTMKNICYGKLNCSSFYTMRQVVRLV